MTISVMSVDCLMSPNHFQSSHISCNPVQSFLIKSHHDSSRFIRCNHQVSSGLITFLGSHRCAISVLSSAHRCKSVHITFSVSIFCFELRWSSIRLPQPDSGTGIVMREIHGQCCRLQHRHRRDGMGYVPLTTMGCARRSFAAGSDPSCRLRRSALLHHSLSPAEGSTNSTWPRKGQAKATRMLVLSWTSCGCCHGAASGVNTQFRCVQGVPGVLGTCHIRGLHQRSARRSPST